MKNIIGFPVVGFIYGFAFTGKDEVGRVLVDVADQIESKGFGLVNRELFLVDPAQEGAYSWSEDYEKYSIYPLIQFKVYTNENTGEQMLLIYSGPLSKIVSMLTWTNPSPFGGSYVESTDSWSGVNRDGWGVAELFGATMGFEQKPGWWHFVVSLEDGK